MGKTGDGLRVVKKGKARVGIRGSVKGGERERVKGGKEERSKGGEKGEGLNLPLYPYLGIDPYSGYQ
jgi:hypothetical protein